MNPQPEHPAIDTIILLMVSGMNEQELAAACVAKLGIPTDKVTAVIADARRKLTIAADYNRDEEIGTARTRLNNLYARAIRSADNKTALQAQRELNRLLDLYARPDSGQGTGEDSASIRRQLEAIEGHLRPLKLADDSYPVEELARLAADFIRNAKR
jgi:peptidoglycan hydrolase-like protein with peptidoglycan-binding domain